MRCALILSLIGSLLGCSLDRSPTREGTPQRIALRAGQTRTLSVPGITKVQVLNPRVADVRVHNRSQVSVVGFRAGTTKVEISNSEGTRRHEVVVSGVARRRRARRAPVSRPGATLRLSVGSSRVVSVPRSITKLAVMDPRVADLTEVRSRQFLVVGVSPGQTRITVSTPDGPPLTYRVEVR